MAQTESVVFNGAALNDDAPTALVVTSSVVDFTTADTYKRAFDIVVSGLALIAMLPVLLLIAIAVRLESSGSPVYRQRRLGRSGQPFPLLKFRTMRSDAEDQLLHDPQLAAEFRGNGWKLPKGHDQRVTRVGAILRSTSLDELPQLINVLLGHMSLVGPRPPLVDQITELYGEHQDAYFSVRPGLSGAWQVGGRSDLSQAERRDLDLDYIATRSMRRDLAILAATVPAVLSRRGAY